MLKIIVGINVCPEHPASSTLTDRGDCNVPHHAVMGSRLFSPRSEDREVGYVLVPRGQALIRFGGKAQVWPVAYQYSSVQCESLSLEFSQDREQYLTFPPKAVSVAMRGQVTSAIDWVV